MFISPFCSEWVLGNREDLVKDITAELLPEMGEVILNWNILPLNLLFARGICAVPYAVVFIFTKYLKRKFYFLWKEWWTYVCLGPTDPHPNWHLCMRGTQHRAVMWRVWKEGGTGFLYWGSNCYEKATVASAEVLLPEYFTLFN